MELEKFKDLSDLPDDELSVPPKIRPVLEDLRTMRKYTIPTYPLFIGRERKSSICVPVPAISRRHAKVFEREGEYYIQDMGSINGTFINDKRILDPVQLKEGDRVKVGVTKKYPKGAREFLFKSQVSEQERLAQEQKEEREKILKEVGLLSSGTSAEKKIALRHCIYQATKRDFVSVFKSSEGQRVSLLKLDIANKILQFRILTPFRIKDTVVFSIGHPRLPEPLKLTLRITQSKKMESYGIFEIQGLIIKCSKKHQALYETLIDPSTLICYLKSQIINIDET